MRPCGDRLDESCVCELAVGSLLLEGLFGLLALRRVRSLEYTTLNQAMEARDGACRQQGTHEVGSSGVFEEGASFRNGVSKG